MPACDGQRLLTTISEDQEAEKGMLALSWPPSFSRLKPKTLVHGMESRHFSMVFPEKTFTDTKCLPH